MRRDADRLPSPFFCPSVSGAPVSCAPPRPPPRQMAPLALALPLAQTAPAGGGMGPIMQFAPLLLIVIVFYFFILRPQSRREKDRRALIDAVKKGDKVVTAGGIHGTVTQVDEGTVLVQVDANVKLRFEKNAISTVTA